MGNPEVREQTIILFSHDLDRVMAAFNIAIGASAMGLKVNMFFTFWGICALRKKSADLRGRGWLDKMFSWMLPAGAEKLALSQMNFGGLGTAFMKKVMLARKVPPLSELIHSAQDLGVTFTACAMTMEMMGIRQEDLIEGVRLGGVASYLEHAEQSKVNLFI